MNLTMCPKCKSTDVELQSTPLLGIVPVGHVCKKCGHKGLMFPEVEQE